MVKLVKIVDNKYVQIEEYKNPNICFNTNEYSDFEDYCTLRETFDPFEIFYENQELKSQLKGTTYCFDEEEHRVLKKQLENCYCNRTDCTGRIKDSKKYDSLVQKVETQQKEFIKYLEDEKDRLSGTCDIICVSKFDEADDNLQEYKRIIGVSYEKK